MITTAVTVVVIICQMKLPFRPPGYRLLPKLECEYSQVHCRSPAAYHR
jgi:hypothetical protein